MVFRGTIPSSEEAYEIYELGIFPSSPTGGQTFEQLSLVSGSRTDGWKNNGADVLDPNTTLPEVPTNSCFISSAPTGFTGGFRVGNEALFIKSGDTLNVNKTFNQFTSAGQNAFLADDYITVAYSKIPADTPALTLKFLYNGDNYFYKTVTLPSGTSYGFISILRSEFSIYGENTLSWGNITGDLINQSDLIDEFNDIKETYEYISKNLASLNYSINRNGFSVFHKIRLFKYYFNFTSKKVNEWINLSHYAAIYITFKVNKYLFLP
jgi:hypothetical protein